MSITEHRMFRNEYFKKMAIGELMLPFGYLFMMNFSIFWWIPCGLILLVIVKYIKPTGML
jgi:hypothetical protein